jgi:hypothetical protein
MREWMWASESERKSDKRQFSVAVGRDGTSEITLKNREKPQKKEIK